MSSKEKVAFILGAGFSKCAGIPVQAEFSNLILSDFSGSEVDKQISKTIKTFLSDIYGWSDGDPIPGLEDIFTNIDLSAGTGHHLGIKYKPNLLRAFRRMLIYRVFQIIDFKYTHSMEIETLLRYYQRFDCSFVVLNWDIVLENHLRSVFPDLVIDYGIQATDWNDLPRPINPIKISIYKMHGSSNWAYCENCKEIYYQVDEKLPLRTKVGLIKSDFRLFNQKFSNKYFDTDVSLPHSQRQCKSCNNSLSTHIATFSFRKSFRTSAYPAIWSAAEKSLSEASKWIFIGYSLPEADFELKHLLKTAELQKRHKIRNKKLDRKIEVVTRTDPWTKSKYEALFGKKNISIIGTGLSGYVASLAATTIATPGHALT